MSTNKNSIDDTMDLIDVFGNAVNEFQKEHKGLKTTVVYHALIGLLTSVMMRHCEQTERNMEIIINGMDEVTKKIDLIMREVKQK